MLFGAMFTRGSRDRGLTSVLGLNAGLWRIRSRGVPVSDVPLYKSGPLGGPRNDSKYFFTSEVWWGGKG